MSILVVSLLLLLLAAADASSVKALLRPSYTSTIGHQYQYIEYKQCDSRWGKDQMGVSGDGERATICQEGCAMTSTAMVLATLGAVVKDKNKVQLVNPGNFNAWLKENKGYTCDSGDCNNLVLTAPERLSPLISIIGENKKRSYEEIADSIAWGRIANLAHVRNNTHFVLLVAAVPSKRAFLVNDPAYAKPMYKYDEISDIISYKINIYPVYKQCDDTWGSKTMGKNGETICQVGCLMSSIASALTGSGIPIHGRTATPERLDEFLQQNNGFEGNSSALEENVIPLISPSRISWNETTGMHKTNDIPFDTIVKMIDAKVPAIVIANVRHGQHFVLVVGYRADGDTLVVNDSGFDVNTYSYSKDVVGWRIFHMQPLQQKKN